MQFHLKVVYPEFVVRSIVKDLVQLVHLSRLPLCGAFFFFFLLNQRYFFPKLNVHYLQV